MAAWENKLVQDPEQKPEEKKDLKRADLVPGYMYDDEFAAHFKMTTRKVSLYRRMGLLKAVKLGKAYVYRKEWGDQFMEEWAGYDLSNEEAVKFAIREKEWRKNHGC